MENLIDAMTNKKELDKNKKHNRRLFTIWSILIPPVIISSISMYHLVKLFDIGDIRVMSYISAFSFEVLSLAVIVGVSQLRRKRLLWTAIILLFMLQALGNSFYTYINLDPVLVNKLMELFGIETSITMSRYISFILGTIFPLTSLTFVKNLSDFIERKK